MKITICGAFAYQEQMKEVAEILKAAGHDVHYPVDEDPIALPDGRSFVSVDKYIAAHGDIDTLPLDDIIWHEKGRLMKGYFPLIESSDAVLIANYARKGVPGYIGANVLMEIAVAFRLGKKLFLMERPSSQLSCAEEVLGTQPVIIDGDLAKIV